MLDAIRYEVRYALRAIRARPGFAAMVAATFVIGIGANATMFGIIDHLLLRAPPQIRDPDRLVQLHSRRIGNTDVQSTQNYAVYKDYRDNVPDFASVAVATSATVGRKTYFPLGRGPSATRVSGSLVSASYFPMLGVRPALGRFFGPDEDNETNPRQVAVIGWGFWQRHFAGRTTAIGSVLDVGTDRFTVVGVAPQGFNGTTLTDVDLWLPITAASGLRFDKTPGWANNRNAQWLNIFARLKPGVREEQALAQATAAFRAGEAIRIAASKRPAPESPDSQTVVFGSIVPGKSKATFGIGVSSPEVRVAKLLSGVALLVLIIACANIANLLLARALNRRREIAVRLALGVSQRRLVGQLLIEGMMLALLGAAGALVVTQFGSQVLRRWLLGDAAWNANAVDLRVLVFTACAAIVTGVVTSLAPALQASRRELTNALKSGAREGTVYRSRLRDALVVAQAALAIVLMTGAGLFVRSLRNAGDLPLGVDLQHVLVAQIAHASAGLNNEQALRLHLDFVERTRTLPGVSAAAVSIALPFSLSWGADVSVPGRTLPRVRQEPVQYAVTSQYFKVLRIPLLAGRPFTDADGLATERVVIVNENMARLYWPTQSPIGQCLRVGAGADTMPCSAIVGVVGNTRRQDIVEGLVPQLYRPLVQLVPSETNRTVSFFGYTLIVRTVGDPAVMIEPVRRAIQSASPIVPYANVQPMESLLDPKLQAWRLGARAFSVFGGLALVLAVVGLYSVVTFTVLQRLHEFGVRVALGAQRSDIARLTIARGVMPVIIGIVIGSALALAGGRLVASLLFRVSPRDPVVLGAVSAVLLSAAALAALIPAWRATRVNPIAALRAE